VGITSANRYKNLANVHTSNSSVWFSPSTTHTSLKPIRSSARQHLVDTDDVEWVCTILFIFIRSNSPRKCPYNCNPIIPNSHVEGVLSSNLYQVFIGTDTSSLKSLGTAISIAWKYSKTHIPNVANYSN
jgi:hypothetical protein